MKTCTETNTEITKGMTDMVEIEDIGLEKDILYLEGMTVAVVVPHYIQTQDEKPLYRSGSRVSTIRDRTKCDNDYFVNDCPNSLDSAIDQL